MVSISKIKTFCQLFFDSTNIPITLYHHDRPVLKLPQSDLDFISNHLRQLRDTDDAASFLTAGDAFYALIKANAAFYAVVGPVTGLRCNSQMVQGIIRDSSILPQYEAAVADYLNRIPCMPFNRLIKQVAMVHFGLTGIPIDVDKAFHSYLDDAATPVSTTYAQSRYEAKEEDFTHNSYFFEQELLKCVEDGNIERLKKVTMRPEAYHEGIVADNSLRQAKNMFITMVTLATRTAIRGGFDIESSYALSDVYIREMERLTTVEAVYKLSGCVLYDFTRQVARNKYANGLSPDVSRCMNYIMQNTNQPINVSEVARYTGLSRSYLSRKFKSELGFNLSSYILRCKLEEARSLLAYTNKSISDISSYLCFSSQSHFQNVFKSQYNQTPGAFRRQAV